MNAIDPDINFYSRSNSCNNYDIASFNLSFSVPNKYFFIIHQNIRSFNCNIDEFILYIHNLVVKPDVIILSETWFNCDNFHGLNGYSAYHTYRRDRGGGGISVFVKVSLTSNHLPELSIMNSEIETCAVKVSLENNEMLNIVGVYRPPSSNIEIFCNFIRDEILNCFTSNELVLLGGDLNINLADYNSSHYLSDAMQSNTFIPLISIPTRVTETSSTIIDHFWSNMLSNTISGVFLNELSDHFTIFTCFIRPKLKNNCIAVKFRDHSQEHLLALRNEALTVFETFHVYQNMNVNVRTSIFMNLLWTMYNKHCPVRQKTFPESKNKKPWLDSDLIKLCKMKHDMYRDYKRGIVSFGEYKYFKNNLLILIRKCKFLYYSEIFHKAKGDMKQTWRNVNNLIGNNRRNVVTEVVYNNNKVTSAKEISELFNNYFGTIASNLQSNIPASTSTPMSFMGDSNEVSIDCVQSTNLEIKNIIIKMANKNCNVKNIPVSIFKLLADVISPVISDLFNSSLKEKIFPTVLKYAVILPLHKSGKVNDIKNYRPISLLNVMSKIFEKLMKSRIMEFVLSCDIISKDQFGFRAGHDTSDAVLQFLDKVYQSFNEKSYMVSIFLDFSKAFDTIDHSILLAKLNHLGIRGDTLHWLESYLRDRDFSVSVGSALSSGIVSNMGVPQGSVLGPILFILYINDMQNCSDVLRMINFADDTTVFSADKNINSLFFSINQQMSNLDRWIISNKLSLNFSKTKYIIFSHNAVPQNLDIFIRNEKLSRVSNTNFLGIHIDEKLTFKHHVNFLSNKISRSIGILYRIKSFIPSSVLISLYYAFVQSHLSYGICTWGKSAKTYINRLSSLQNRCISMLPSYNSLSNYVKYEILKVDQLYEFFILIKFNKYIKSENFADKHVALATNALLPTHSYSTRHKCQSKLNTVFYRKSVCHKSFIYNATNLWNNIPAPIKSIPCDLKFKKLLKHYLLDR